MKINLLLLFAFFFFALDAMSQNSFGLKAGINLAYQTDISTSTLYPNRTYQTKSLIGYQLGIFYKAKISKKLVFSTEANFSVVGAKDLYLSSLLDTDTLTIHYNNNKIGYLEVPLMIQYNLKRFYVGAGPALSYKIFSKSPLPNVMLYYTSFDVGADLLGGMHISKKWDINLRYNSGLLDISEDPKMYGKKKNKNLNLTLLYLIK